MAHTDYNGITVKGAREHNLKNVTLHVPRDKITVITGLSGSGKSSVAFDIIYAEGQRRYVESLSAYARNFMEQLKKPDVDSITGLSPSIAIDQKTTITNPRSTVGTTTEIYDFLRLLYARIGHPKCPIHQLEVKSQKPQQIVEDVFSLAKATKFFVLAPVVQDQKGEFLAEFQKWARKGFVRAKVDGQWVELEKAKKLAKHKRHNIDLLIDRLIVEDKYKTRLNESLNLALTMAKGMVKIEPVGKESKLYSIHQACPECGYSFLELDPRMFSFNNPRGACAECDGLGYIEYENEYEGGDEEGAEDDFDPYSNESCGECKGARLNAAARNVIVDGKNISQMSELPASELLEYLNTLPLVGTEKIIGDKILKQIKDRLSYIVRVGTGYLSLSRPTRTLSGGEMQRIRLASQVGSSLIGVLYVLDEPSIGLHPRDHQRLLEIIKEIRDRGNTVILVEHDEDTIASADYVIDLGPGAGILGGELLVEGSLEKLLQTSQSLTAQYLTKKKSIPLPKERRKGNGKYLKLSGTKGNNLKNVDLEIPLGVLCGITGVSGSGKSTLIIDTLYRICAQHFYDSHQKPAPFDKVEGLENLDKVIEINQKPIGRTPRSTPATYVGVLPIIRDLFARLPEAKIRGYKPGHFSFNVKGGRCENCQGLGAIKVEMHFLSDVYVECDRCYGTRYNPEVQSIKFRDKNIAEVLKMSVGEAEKFFTNHKNIHLKLKTLCEVGLDYISLGQSSTTISGGEAQRTKLSKELSKRSTGKTLYILDEPTTGLHFEDVRKLVELLQKLVQQGNTVIVIEHHLDVIKNCDHIIDIGPDGGKAGGVIVASGTPEEICRVKASETGKFLKEKLKA
ncbi:MAG: excinuclease ABC subunit UvrA [Bdellovibrionaceae bacterium]|nr:excinuclease ABC subunit UvrA [Pseudobdellovibrionaceae bacterium]